MATMNTVKGIYNVVFRTLVAGTVGGLYIVLLTFLFVFISGKEALALHPWLVPALGLGPSVLGVLFLTVLFSILPLFSFIRDRSREEGVQFFRPIAFVWALPLALTLFSSLILRTATGGLMAILSGLLGVAVAAVTLEAFPVRSLNLLSRVARKLDRRRLGGFDRHHHA
jgi:hypothetical protein